MGTDADAVVSGPPAVEAGGGEGRSEAAELAEIRGRLVALQEVLAERFSRQGWDEYMRLRRVMKARPG